MRSSKIDKQKAIENAFKKAGVELRKVKKGSSEDIIVRDDFGRRYMVDKNLKLKRLPMYGENLNVIEKYLTSGKRIKVVYEKKPLHATREKIKERRNSIKRRRRKSNSEVIEKLPFQT